LYLALLEKKKKGGAPWGIEKRTEEECQANKSQAPANVEN